MRVITASGVGLLLTALLHLPAPAAADEWDSSSIDDDGPGTQNALHPGSEQVHDLAAVGGVADQDWFRFNTRPYSSYQVVVDGQTGDLDMATTDFQRLDTSEVVQQSAPSPGFGGVLNLSWIDPGASPGYIRVRSSGCAAVPCTSADQYRIRFYETTGTIPRFNNTGTQVTVLVLQNVTDRTCEALIHLESPSGDVNLLIGLSPYATEVLNTLPNAANRSGHVRIAHYCGFGGLSGKAVAIEPATGFTFDTEMVHRPH